MWGQLKSLGYSKVSGGSSKIVLEENGTKVFEPVSNIFNCFYTSVASDLVSKLPSPSGLFSTSSHHFRSLYSRLRNRDSFVISPLSRVFIRKRLLSLNPKKGIGLDDLSSRFLRDAVDEIIEPVSHIVNLSITSEMVPSSFKQAKVIPLFKKGSKLDPGNYRPVSILSVLSKLLERAVCTQMNEYLEKRHILFENQSGFRGRYSTDTCLSDLTDYVKGEMSAGRYFKLLHVFKIVHGTAPSYLTGRFVPITGTHTHNTRSSGYNFHVSKALSCSPTSFSYTSIKEWNDLPVALKAIVSEKLFRQKLRDYLSLPY